MEGINLYDTPKHIKGISCSVRNCIYNEDEQCCTAERIAVGPSCASCSSETVCATFKKKSEGKGGQSFS